MTVAKGGPWQGPANGPGEEAVFRAASRVGASTVMY